MNEVVKGSSMAYEYGFKACRRCVARMLSRVDLSHLQHKDSDDEDELAMAAKAQAPKLAVNEPTIEPAA